MKETKPMRFNVVTGKFLQQKIESPFWAGNAVYYSDEGYFELQISLFDSPWYLSQNLNKSETYTIFRRKTKKDDRAAFSLPIGKAFFADKEKQFLQLSVPLWNPKFNAYLNLREPLA